MSEIQTYITTKPVRVWVIELPSGEKYEVEADALWNALSELNNEWANMDDGDGYGSRNVDYHIADLLDRAGYIKHSRFRHQPMPNEAFKVFYDAMVISLAQRLDFGEEPGYIWKLEQEER